MYNAGSKRLRDRHGRSSLSHSDNLSLCVLCARDSTYTCPIVRDLVVNCVEHCNVRDKIDKYTPLKTKRNNSMDGVVLTQGFTCAFGEGYTMVASLPTGLG